MPKASPKTKRNRVPARPRQFEEQITSEYLAKLDTALSDPKQFGTLFLELKSDPLVRKAEAQEIANRFGSAISRSMTKEQALKSIHDRHLSRIRTELQRDATSKRSAG
jgi:hypothetical protein